EGGAAIPPAATVLVGKLVRLDEVPPPHLGPLQAEIGRDRVHHPFHYEAGVGPASATVGRGGGQVGIEVAKADAVVRHAVGTGQLRRRDDRQDDPVRGVGAGVVDEVDVESPQAALVVVSDLHLVNLGSLLV